MEDDLNGRQPQGKRFSEKGILMEVNLFGSLTQAYDISFAALRNHALSKHTDMNN